MLVLPVPLSCTLSCLLHSVQLGRSWKGTLAPTARKTRSWAWNSGKRFSNEPCKSCSTYAAEKLELKPCLLDSRAEPSSISWPHSHWRFHLLPCSDDVPIGRFPRSTGSIRAQLANHKPPQWAFSFHRKGVSFLFLIHAHSDTVYLQWIGGGSNAVLTARQPSLQAAKGELAHPGEWITYCTAAMSLSQPPAPRRVAAAEKRQYSASAKSQSAPAAPERVFTGRQVLLGATSADSVRFESFQDFSMLECFDKHKMHS